MGATYFFTGYPGFLATHLIKEIIHQGYAIDQVYLLHLPDMKHKAEDSIQQLSMEGLISADKLTAVEGNITKPGLGLQPTQQEQLREKVTHVYHLAAIYDLAVPLQPAWQVNVNGTSHINEWLKGLKQLKRYTYFSTAYVSGKREGTIYEHELEHNAGFKNHYEYTKYEAERTLASIMNEVPTTIIRPGIVIGDSKTGETMKFDGPYLMLNLLERIRRSPIVPYFGKGNAYVNLVPLDYVIQATIELSHNPSGEGKTYHLTDPRPYKARDIYKMLLNEYLQKEPRFSLPMFLTEKSLSLPQLRKALGVQKESLAYFTCESNYDCTQALEDLRSTPIRCPDLKEVIPHMVDYYEQHKHDREKHPVIH
ncbi:SDR family oxidoreductase [Thalassobacillus hwangdonensis]|uniref:SDR family oxidoreductase n=1 Tax=Thalassobacillus hwangdonensis TaxID=546108 RepID=A0ABW3L1C7_9BACI